MMSDKLVRYFSLFLILQATVVIVLWFASQMPAELADSLKMDTAHCFLFIGIGLYFQSVHLDKTKQVFFGIAGLWAFSGFVRHLTGIDVPLISLPNLLVKSNPMTLLSSICFLMIVGGLFLANFKSLLANSVSQWLFTSVLILTYFRISVFVYGLSNSSSFSFISNLGIITSVLLCVMAGFLMFLKPNTGLAFLLSRKNASGQFARLAFPFMVLLVLLAGIFALRFPYLGILSYEDSIAVFGIVILIVSMIFIALVTNRLNYSSDLIAKAENELLKTNTRLEEKVQERTTSLKKTIDLMNLTNRVAKIGGWEADMVENTVTWSSMMRQICGVGLDFKPRMDTMMSFFKEGENRHKIALALNNALSMGLSWDMDLVMASPDGSEKWVHTIGHPEFKNGKCIRINGTIQDIDELKKSELLALQEKQHFQSILDNLPLNIYVKDIESRKTLVNKGELDFMGAKSSDEVVGKSDWELYPSELAAVSIAEDRQVLETGKAILAQQTTTVSPMGEVNWFLTSKIPMRNAEGEITSILGVSVDITEKKVLEEKIKNAKNPDLKSWSEMKESLNKTLASIYFTASDVFGDDKVITKRLTVIDLGFKEAENLIALFESKL